MIRQNFTCIISLVADQDEQANAASKKKCWDKIVKICTRSLFVKIAVWVILALFAFSLVAMGLLGHWVLGFMACLGGKAEPIQITTTALTMIGGIGAVGYLVIKYQERTAAQRAEQREQRAEQRTITRQQADELLDAIHLLGDDKASTRIAGVQSLVQIGQSRPEIRQRIIDILCGYLRTDRDNDSAVESTILTTLHEHLIPRGPFTPLFWADINLDLRNSTITEPIDFSGIYCRNLNMSGTHINSEEQVNFRGATFTNAACFKELECTTAKMLFKDTTFGTFANTRENTLGADFSYATLHDCHFEKAQLIHANFEQATVENGDFIESYLYKPKFVDARITGATFQDTKLWETNFNAVRFTTASFEHVQFLCKTTFSNSHFMGTTVFDSCDFTGNLDFTGATFGIAGATDKHECIYFDDSRIFSETKAKRATSYASWSFYHAHFLRRNGDKPTTSTLFIDQIQMINLDKLSLADASFELYKKEAKQLEDAYLRHLYSTTASTKQLEDKTKVC